MIFQFKICLIKPNMGIKNLNKFLRKNCPDVFEEFHISEYSFQKVAIDISLYLCKFKTVCGDRWITAFLNLISCLRKNEVHCVFIYDSGAPPEKELERQERKIQQEKLEARVFKLEESLEQFHLSGEIDQVLIDLYAKNIKKDTSKRLLSEKANSIDMKYVEGIIKKTRGQMLNITQEDFDLTKKLFDILQVPYFDAPLEAETMCSDLCKQGLVDAVLSEDTDVLAYGAPMFLSKICTADGTCVRIKYLQVLEELELSADQFLDLCIMCGTDYNKNIFRVGPEKAYKFIQTHSSIEGIEENTKLDTSVLNHVRGRELFLNYSKTQIKIPYCGSPNKDKLVKFVEKHNIRCNVDGLMRSFVHSTTIVFDEDEEE